MFTKHKYRGSKRTEMTKQCRKHCYDHLTHVAWMNLAEIVDEWSSVFSKRPVGQKTQTTWTNVIWYMCAIKYRDRMLFKVVTEKYIYRRKKCLIRGLSWWFLFGVATVRGVGCSGLRKPLIRVVGSFWFVQPWGLVTWTLQVGRTLIID